MSVWTIDTINPIESGNLRPADKQQKESAGGGGRGGEGAFLLMASCQPDTAESALVLEGKYFRSAFSISVA